MEHGPALLTETLARKARQGKLTKAVVLVHLYGQSADIAPIQQACATYGVTLIEDAAFIAQARDDAPHYQHSEIGYNYRLSNVLASIGRGQIRVLEDRVQARRRNFAYYQEMLGHLPGIAFREPSGREASWGRHTRWLTCMTVNPAAFGITREDLRLALEAENIEARPVWKPMHCQPVFAGCESVGGRCRSVVY